MGGSRASRLAAVAPARLAPDPRAGRDAAPVPPGIDCVVVDPNAPALDGLAAALIEALPEERRLAAARRAPALREPLAHRLIQEVAFANAQFALVTNLPTLLPGVGTAA